MAEDAESKREIDTLDVSGSSASIDQRAAARLILARCFLVAGVALLSARSP
jgi:hypothetical protein